MGWLETFLSVSNEKFEVEAEVEAEAAADTDAEGGSVCQRASGSTNCVVSVVSFVVLEEELCEATVSVLGDAKKSKLRSGKKFGSSKGLGSKSIGEPTGRDDEAWVSRGDVSVNESGRPKISLASLGVAGLWGMVGIKAIVGPSLCVFIDEERRPVRWE